MKSVGIICEYNPFHNGHLYHLNKVKEMCPDHIIILIMSSSFLERGEASIINKWKKTDIALYYGVDLVVELPFAFSSQSADIFAKGSIELLNYLGVSTLIFGSEIGDIDTLSQLACTQIDNKQYNNKIKDHLNNGLNYPTALSKSLEEINGIGIKSPNDILGISYIREIKKMNSSIKPLCIKRTNDYHSLELDNDIVSATSIRKAIERGESIQNYVPSKSFDNLQHDLHFIDNYFPFLKYKILTNLNNLEKYQTVDEGIENRIKQHIVSSTSLADLIDKVKTKRYTYNRIRRMFTHILCGFTKEEANEMKNIEYIRILGFSDNGKKYLNTIKKNLEVPLITTFSKLKNKMLDLEFRVTAIYASILKETDKADLIESEYKNKPIIK